VDEITQDVTRVQELVYELRVEQVMNRDVITVTPDCAIRDLKEILRTKRISGAPVMMGDELIGMISIENLIQALERGDISGKVRDQMTVEVRTIRTDDSVVSAVNMFVRYGFGRFPVVDGEGNLVGILTKGDIIRGLLRQMEVQWQEEEIHRYRASHIFEDIESDQTALILRYRVAKNDFERGGEASSKIKRALERLGADPRIVRRVAVATYEAETNLIIHSVGGEIIAEVRPDRLRITAVDSGPGIMDIESALRPGFSTAPDWIREMGFGAGMGFSNIKACSNEMKLTSEVGVGTRLELTFDLQ